MARSTLEILLDSVQDREEKPAEDLPRLPQRPLSRGRLPSSRSGRLLATLSSDRSPHSSASYGGGSCDPCAHAFTTTELINGRSDPCPSIAKDGPEHTVLNGNQVVMAQETLVQASIAEGKNGKDSPLKDHDILDERSADGRNGSFDPFPSTATDESHHSDELRIEHAQLSEYRVMTTQESVGQSTIAKSNMKKENGKRSSAQERTKDVAMAEGDTLKGRKVWFLNQESKWAQGLLHSICDMEAMVSLQDGQVVRLQSNRLLPANPDVLDDVENLVQLSFINEPSILHTLRRRYGIGKSYTRAGSMLISITSSMEHQRDNRNGLDASGLHVRAVADSTFEAMKRDAMNQSIIISGANDADKLATMKLTLRNLVSLGGNPGLAKMLLLVHPIMEAFAYVKPSSKTNTSYVGEMVNLFYDNSKRLSGAEWKTVLFKELRVAHQAEGQCTYNIFYQLCGGADSVLKDKLNLLGVGEFSYLNKMELGLIDGINYHTQFQSVIDSLYAFGVSSQDQEHIFTMLAAILWLGNITLPTLGNESQAVGNAARLLQCSREQLLGALSNISCDSVEVIVSKDLLAQSIYERLFRWLMVQINKTLQSELCGEYKSINIVNMPGFGLSQSKGLDGLLVNYSYEYLQHFIQCHLSQLEEEDIICGQSRIGSAPKAVLEFLEQALFPLLKNVSKSGHSDFTNRLETLIDNSSCSKQKNRHEYSIYHIFGEATYDSTQILKGLNKVVGGQHLEILHSCMSQLPYNSEKNDMDVHHTCTPISSELDSDVTRTSRCQEWVHQVLQHLKSSSPSFILCIMPNKLLLNSLFEEEFVLEQLRLNRLTEAVEQSRTHHGEQISQQLFASRFGTLVAPAPNVATGQDELGICIEILQRFNVPPYMYRVGLRNLFFYPGQLDKLEQIYKKHVLAIVAVQKTYRGYKVRCSFKKQKKASTYLQASIRAWLVRKSYAHHTVKKNMIGRTLGDNIDAHEKMLIRTEENVGGENGVEKDANDKACSISEGLNNKCMRKEDRQGGQQQMLATLQRKEEENAILQQTIKEYERKWTVYETKMKSMEEMWTKQIATLQQNLRTSKTVVEVQPSIQEKHNEGGNASGHRSSYENVQGNSAEIPCNRESNASISDLDPSRSVIDRLLKEFEHRTQVFNDDAHFLVEVKSGQIEANFKPESELQKLKQRFEIWKKDFKGRLKETKNMLKKLGKPESAEKKKKWWGGR